MVANTVLELTYLDLHPWQVNISSTHLHELVWLEALTQARLFPTRPWFVPPLMFHLAPSVAGLSSSHGAVARAQDLELEFKS